MPSDEMVEKVARAIYEGTTPILRESLGPRWAPVDFAVADANTRRVHHVMARAALAAAEAGEQPVGYMTRADIERLMHGEQHPGGQQAMVSSLALFDHVHPVFASPPSEASRDERVEHMLKELEKRLERRLADLRDSDAVRHADIIVRKEFSALATAIRARGET